MAFHTRSVLPSGEDVWETLIPNGVNPDIVVISTNQFRSFVFPTVGKYYSLPIRKTTAGTVNDPQCATQAARIQGAKMVTEVKLKGFQAFQYDGSNPNGTRSSAWLFPAAGCAILQSVTDFGTSRTYQMLQSLTPGFSDFSVLTPKGVAGAPLDIFHDLYVKRVTSPANPAPKTTEAAEAQWAADMADHTSKNYKSVYSLQPLWEKHHH